MSDTTPTRLVALSGSLRAGSWNTRLLEAAAALAPAGVVLDLATPRGIPLYDGDAEAAEGIPAAVVALKDRIAAADGLLIATPEYNNGMPGVLKNTLDWLSRPPKDSARVFAGLPVAVCGASTGGFGTILSQAHILPVLRTLGTRPWFGGRLMVSRADTVFDAEGRIGGAALREQVARFVAGFAAFANGGSARHGGQGGLR